MARNIEIKARIDSVQALLPAARALAGGAEPVLIEQDDSFYPCSHGRLKLRRFPQGSADGSAELIHYQRADAGGPKLSDYVRVPVPDADALHTALARAQGELGRVRKRRWLLLVGPTRVHLDEVQGLGHFLELEVVLGEGQTEAEGEAVARQLLAALGVQPQQLLAGAYLDLLAARA